MSWNIKNLGILKKQEDKTQIENLQDQCRDLMALQEKIKKDNEILQVQKAATDEEIQRLKCLCTELEKEKERVYAGHRGLEEEINFLKYRVSSLDDLHESIVQKKWPHDGSMQKYGCLYPFMRVEILPRGEVYTCCSAYLKHNYYIGNIYEEDFSQIWNSFRARNLRKSVMEGNFEYCMKLCKFLHEAHSNNGNVSKFNPIIPREKLLQKYTDSFENQYQMSSAPTSITLTCDESCNLACPTCRSQRKVMSKEESDQLLERLEKSVKPMLQDCEELSLLTSGEVFASRAISAFLKTITHDRYPKLEVRIVTNLQLLDAGKWEEFSNLKRIPMRLMVSVDGACRETYEKNRRGAKWERLIENLELIKQMRTEKKCRINYLFLNFVVQQNNYHEMDQFIEFAKGIGADYVNFQKLTNWGTFREEEYKQYDVCSPTHPEHPLLIRKMKRLLRETKGLGIEQNILEESEFEEAADSKMKAALEQCAGAMPINFEQGMPQGLLSGWYPKDVNQEFCFVNRCSTVLLKPLQGQKSIRVKGFIPPSVTEVRRLDLYVEGKPVGFRALASGDSFDLIAPLQEDPGDGYQEIVLVFDQAHKPVKTEMDQRVVSACIFSIE